RFWRMIRRVARASRTASATAPTPPWTTVMSAAAMAAPVPVATAMPMSAAASAGASLLASPALPAGPRSRRSQATSGAVSAGRWPYPDTVGAGGGGHPAPGHRLGVAGAGRDQAAVAGGRDHGAGQRVLGGGLGPGGQRQRVGPVGAVERRDTHDGRMAGSQGAG